MSTELDITQGAEGVYRLQCWNQGAMTTPVFQAADVMTATVSPGEGQPALFAPDVAWWTAPDPVTGNPTQTGFDQAQVLVTVHAADGATLQAEAGYLLQVW